MKIIRKPLMDRNQHLTGKYLIIHQRDGGERKKFVCSAPSRWKLEQLVLVERIDIFVFSLLRFY